MIGRMISVSTTPNVFFWMQKHFGAKFGLGEPK
jgi:hypothetical protein